MKFELFQIQNVIVFLIVALLLFVVFREVVTWYWKLTAIDNKLAEMKDEMRSHQAAIMGVLKSIEKNTSNKTDNNKS